MSNSLEKGENAVAVGMDQDELELAKMGAHPDLLSSRIFLIPLIGYKQELK
jgi:hypothetical protein